MDEKKKKKSTGIESPPATAVGKIVEQKAPEPKYKPGQTVKINPGRIDRIKG